MELAMGLEPTTCGLQIRRSTNCSYTSMKEIHEPLQRGVEPHLLRNRTSPRISLGPSQFPALEGIRRRGMRPIGQTGHLELEAGLEPATYALRKRRSTS